ncbi:hypothetical protein PUNSTDRAFT_72845 [Punctularia strigosozonata HHB-11173 SS5]|uniref:uncharacterized protein n=1 Tax=Punctularia strigosozonata (strain HHB-11173) TaxID=741275 RepID=UPI0004418104|nr:uncharacterized protein PUNSTDRAFT_72845 [Punctularia strigosozonata HHB-11173 SS5]EIN06729.1 hypothetical protein PUNSTDRAFT_72845 [Punctularia strigosozonata HHB-11173 SS5]
MSLYLCVDCGGSKTSAVICSASGEVLGRALGGPSNFAYLGPAAFKEAVTTAVSDALKTCISPPSISPVPLPPSSPSLRFASAWLGVSGVDSPADVAAVTALVTPLLGPDVNLTVANDTHLLVAPLALHPDISTAVACIGGTGAIAVSFRAGSHGALTELGRFGGWGWMLGDEGGGFHVGREAVRALMRETDEASVFPASPSPLEGSSMQRRILDFFAVDNPFGLLTAVHYNDPDPNGKTEPLGGQVPAYRLMAREKRLSSLAPLVFAAAFDDGDPLALRVLRSCADALADQVAVLLEPDATVPIRAKDSILCFGGSLVGQETYRSLVLEALAKKGHVFKYVEFVDDVAKVGAIGLAKAATS